MVDVDRRRFLQIAGATAATTALSQSIARAEAIPAARVTGSIEDVQHIVVLMQENRSFDHYFGAMRGVRGFGDPHPARLPNGKPIWHQADPATGAEVLPFHPSAEDLGAQFLTGLDHTWKGGQAAFNNGVNDRWIPAKTPTTMAHLERQDASFHYALADAFTVCDAYHCSFIGNTDPNRYYLWTGWTGNDGSGGGPVLYNDEAGYGWTTYPERLEAAGVSWKIYQDEAHGLNAEGGNWWGWEGDYPFLGNYGDNSLLYFTNYQDAQPGDPLFEKARTGTKAKDGQDYFEILRDDVAAGTLPQISWIVAPEAFSEHSNWPTNYGAWYISKVLDALTSNPDVWSRTALFITYDENDGFFDHLVPPHAPNPQIAGKSTVAVDHEYYPGKAGDAAYAPGAYGMGPRVPMLVVSPWSKGGWVDSETFDHTSILRFMERRFGVVEPNITPWRRAVAGDLTSAFDFSLTEAEVPPLPDTTSMAPADQSKHPTYVPATPTTGTMPKQEPGLRRARPLGYRFDVAERTVPAGVAVDIVNRGRLGVHLQARLITPAAAPRAYTVGPRAEVSDTWTVDGAYDLELHGPNGFFRGLAGDTAQPAPTVRVGRRGRTLTFTVTGRGARDVVIEDAYAGPLRLVNGVARLDTRRHSGWYDVRVSLPNTPWQRVYAGHLEDGRPTTSDPALGR